MTFLEKKEPYYFFGTQNGRIFIFPLVFDCLSPRFEIFHAAADSSRIASMAYIKSILIISSDSGLLQAYNMKGFCEKVKSQPAQPSASGLKAGGESQITFTEIQNLLVFEKMLNSPLLKACKIRLLGSLADE